MNEFKLFISGNSSKARNILNSFEIFLETTFGKNYSLKVVDVIKNPFLAQEAGVLITPTLMSTIPPVKKIFGDFSNVEKVMEQLGVSIGSDIPNLPKV